MGHRLCLTQSCTSESMENPTTSKVVWCSLVNVDNVKTAIQKLREINWLYSEVKDYSVDDVSKKVIEIADNASSTMLDKADEHDIYWLSGFQDQKS